MGCKKNEYRDLVRKPEARRSFGRSWVDRRTILK
jgi:hypothetical protein